MYMVTLLFSGINDLNCIRNTAVLTFCLLPCSIGIIAFFDKISHLSKVYELVSDNLIIRVQSDAGYIAFCHFQVTRTFL